MRPAWRSCGSAPLRLGAPVQHLSTRAHGLRCRPQACHAAHALLQGGEGTDALLQFYAEHFIPRMPSDVVIEPLERTVGTDSSGADTVIDEFIFAFTHSVQARAPLAPAAAVPGRRVHAAGCGGSCIAQGHLRDAVVPAQGCVVQLA